MPTCHSQAQPRVTQMAARVVVKEAVWLRNLLAEISNMDERDLSTTIIYGDGQGAIALAKTRDFKAAQNVSISDTTMIVKT